MQINHITNTREDISRIVREEYLHRGPTKIVFTKKDGTIREMICTLDKNILAENDALPGEGDGRRKSSLVIRAYDLEKKDWRSFRIDSIHSCEKYEGAIS